MHQSHEKIALSPSIRLAEEGMPPSNRNHDESLPTAAGYPDRSPVALRLRRWDNSFPDYHPVLYESEAVLRNDATINPNGWADSPHVSRAEFRQRLAAGELSSWEGPVRLDEETGRPCNPYGRTGIEGRGALGKWGPNKAADAIVTRIGEDNESLEILLIKRPSGHWALPGGFLDGSEDSRVAAQRELKEETHVDCDFTAARKVYSGLVIDPRMTDNAWVESEAYHIMVSSDASSPRAGSDAQDVIWIPITPQLLSSLYASHATMIKAAISQMRQAHVSLPAKVQEQLDEVEHNPIVSTCQGLGKRLGIYGGSFDPIHNSHLRVAQAALARLGLDALIFVPAAHNPMKVEAPQADNRERLEMICKIIGNERHFFVDRQETTREGVSRTIDTVRAMRAECGEDVELFLIVGADCVPRFNEWHDYREILRSVTVVPVARDGVSKSDVRAAAMPLGESAANDIAERLIPLINAPYSSTEVRSLLKKGEVVAEMIPKDVCEYIMERDLYSKQAHP